MLNYFIKSLLDKINLNLLNPMERKFILEQRVKDLKKITLRLLLLVCFANNTIFKIYSQNIDKENIFNEKNNHYTLIRSKTLLRETKLVDKVFEINVFETNSYFISFQFLAVKNKNSYKKLIIRLDDEKKAIGDVKSGKDGWQSGVLTSETSDKNQSVFLSAGIHKLTFTYDDFDLPLIEQLNLADSPVNLVINTKYMDEYLNKISSTKLPANYQQLKADGKVFRTLDNPQGNYNQEVDVSYSYTTFITNYYNAGQTITVQTRNSNCDPVLYIFNVSNPGAGSWSNDDSNSGCNSNCRKKERYMHY